MYRDELRQEGSKICIIEDGKERCMDLNVNLTSGKRWHKWGIGGLITAFLTIFIVATVMSWLAGALGYDLVSALIFSGTIMLIPATCMVFIAIIYYVYKTLGFDEVINAIIVILVIVGLGIAAYFIIVWFAVPLILDSWEAMVASW